MGSGAHSGGVQAERAPAVYLSWKAGELRETESSDTFAEGLATRVAFELPFSIIKDRIDDIVLVSEEEMRRAIVALLDEAHMLAEPAGAAPLAAALKAEGERRDREGRFFGHIAYASILATKPA